MAEKLSPELTQFLQTVPTQTTVQLHVMLDKGLAREGVAQVADDLRPHCLAGEAVEVLQHSKMILCTAKADEVAHIAALPSVVWVEMDHKAPLSVLMDR